MNKRINGEFPILFLATTGDCRYWGDSSQPTLFLGEWCKLLKSKNLWNQPQHKTMSYHWDDRNKFEADREYLGQLYEKYLLQCSSSLNTIHSINYSDKYWRILIGLWLREFIDALFDRYLSIESVIEYKANLITWVPKEKLAAPISNPSYSDEYNLYLYSCIIKKFPTIQYEEKQFAKYLNEFEDSFANKIRIFCIKFVKKGIKNLVLRMTRIAVNIFLKEIYPKVIRVFPSRVSIAGFLYISPWHLFWLQLKMKEMPFLFQGKNFALKVTLPNKDMRNGLTFTDSKTLFEKILNELIPEQMPMIFLENYNEMLNKTIINSPVAPKVIITAYSVLNQKAFEFWLSYQSEIHGSKILLMQHGGSYGTARFTFSEEHYLKVFDGYYSWGSNLSGSPKVKRMPSMRLSTSVRGLNSSDSEGGLMWVAARYSIYKTFMDSGLNGPHMSIYIKEQSDFIDCLVSGARSLLIRRYRDDAWDEVTLFKELYPWLQMQFCRSEYNQYSHTTDFVEQLKKCRMIIATCNETSYLESLAANFPTIIYWNPLFVEMRDEVQTYFDQLFAVGILHYTPESAAAMVNHVYANPGVWWDSSPVQAARQKFCDQLAYTSYDWLENWKDELIFQRDQAPVS